MREVLATHRRPLNRFLLKLTSGNRQTAEDLLQETMIRAWRNLDVLPALEEARRRWLFTVARRLVIDDVRRRQVRPVEVPLEVEPITRSDVTASAALANRALRDAVAGLSRAHRQVLHLVFFENLPLPEVARRLGVPEGTVRSRLHYALRAVRHAVNG
ncbi:sigma-70 family RNA polymerase sigma factor [Micromonospora sp. NPDC049366]|uniref:sigma-70 family RNA polymerase sigma factor n=1 Tax=Micromonospora sp. NPDC049366 TaxID=3364271 RepID=UPI0037B0043C